MALYVGDGVYRQSPNIRFYADVVYTNHPPAGAFRGYGVPQGFWPVERHMEKICPGAESGPDRVPPEECTARRRAASLQHSLERRA